MNGLRSWRALALLRRHNHDGDGILWVGIVSHVRQDIHDRHRGHPQVGEHKIRCTDGELIDGLGIASHGIA
jgi:hypothetical protein